MTGVEIHNSNPSRQGVCGWEIAENTYDIYDVFWGRWKLSTVNYENHFTWKIKTRVKDGLTQAGTIHSELRERQENMFEWGQKGSIKGPKTWISLLLFPCRSHPTLLTCYGPCLHIRCPWQGQRHNPPAPWGRPGWEAVFWKQEELLVGEMGAGQAVKVGPKTSTFPPSGDVLSILWLQLPCSKTSVFTWF